MTRTTIALALTTLLAVVPACKKKDEGGTAAKTTEAAKPADKAADKPADKAAEPTPAAAEPAGKPVEMDAPALFEDYNKPGQDPMALLDKWRPGVVVTGTVLNVITEEAGNSSVWLEAGENKRVSLGFKDDGKAAKEKGVKKGDKVSAQCSMGGSDEHLMMLTDCTLK